MRSTDYPDDIRPEEPKAAKPEDFSDLPAHLGAVLRDFATLREEGIPPEGASLLVLAAQVRAATAKMERAAEVALDVWKDPTLAVSFVRFYEKTRENLAKADDELLRGEADLIFEQSLAAMRRQIRESE